MTLDLPEPLGPMMVVKGLRRLVRQVQLGAAGCEGLQGGKATRRRQRRRRRLGAPASLEGPDHIVAAVGLEAGHLQPQNAAPLGFGHCNASWGGAPGGRAAGGGLGSNLATL